MKNLSYLRQLVLLLWLSGNILAQSEQRITNDEKNYSVLIPEGWVTDYAQNGLVSVLYANNPAFPDERLAITTGGSGALSLKEAYKITKRNMKLGKKIPIEREGESKINNMPAKWCIYTLTTDDNEQRKIKMYIFKKGQRLYNVQAQLKPENYNANIATFESVISTFTIGD